MYCYSMCQQNVQTTEHNKCEDVTVEGMVWYCIVERIESSMIKWESIILKPLMQVRDLISYIPMAHIKVEQ